jgi:hypothetical protein
MAEHGEAFDSRLRQLMSRSLLLAGTFLVAPLWWMTMTATVEKSPAVAAPTKNTVHDPLVLQKHPLPLSSNGRL